MMVKKLFYNMNDLFSDNFPVVKTSKELREIKKRYPNYDEYYIASGCILDRKIFFNKLYFKYKPYADRNFLTEIKTNFHQRSWEMYLTCKLIDKGFKISSADIGPDIKIDYNGKNIWIECVAPKKGTGENSVPKIKYGQLCDFPEKEILFRLRQSLEDKFTTYQRYLDQHIISKKDIFIIAINSGELEHVDGEIPLINKCLFSLGYLTININPVQKTKSTPYFSRRENILKNNGSPVSMNFFEDKTHECISGVIYTSSAVLNKPNFILINNPNSKNPIPDSLSFK